jgi:hypothetical protein
VSVRSNTLCKVVVSILLCRVQLNGMESWLRTQELLGDKSDAIPKDGDALEAKLEVSEEPLSPVQAPTTPTKAYSSPRATRCPSPYRSLCLPPPCCPPLCRPVHCPPPRCNPCCKPRCCDPCCRPICCTPCIDPCLLKVSPAAAGGLTSAESSLPGTMVVGNSQHRICV